MNAVDLLAELNRREVTLWMEGDKLRFRAPPDALTDSLRALVAAKRSELVTLVVRGAGAPTDRPLSFEQKGQWFHQRMAPGSSAAHVAFAARLRGALDEEALRRAVARVVERHELLRTTYHEDDTGPLQRVRERVAPHVVRVDASGWAQDALLRALRSAYDAPFDLESGPLLRVDVLSSSESEHLALFTVHHIAADGWSLWLLVDELAELYAAETLGRVASLRPIHGAYAAHVDAQRAMLAGPRAEELARYWKTKLAGVPHTLDLPTDRIRPPVHHDNGATFAFDLDASVARLVDACARAHGVTPFVVLLAAYELLLFRYSGQSEFLVGVPSLGRADARHANVVGNFVNLMALRATFAEGATFAALLRLVRDVSLEAIAHQEYPFLELVSTLGTARDPSRPPLVQAMFVLQKAQAAEGVLAEKGGMFGALRVEPLALPQQEGEFDLVLEAIQSASLYRCSFKYNADIFDAETIAHMSSCFRTLLESAIRSPAEPLETLSILDADEERRVVVDWNETGREFPRDATVHGLVEKQALLRPDAVAIAWGDVTLSYRTLNDRANQLAHRLRALGVGPEVRVCVCMARSADLVVALLAVLKAGGAYVPLDPAYPRARLELMMTDAGAPVLVTESELVARVPAGGAHVVCVDRDAESLRAEPTNDPAPLTTSEALAYVIYTSGSTGRPKGVLVTHRAINRLLFDDAFVPVTSSYRMAQVVSASFDVLTYEIWAPLVHGARIVGIPKEVLLSPAVLVRTIRDAGVNAMFLTPAVFNEVVREEPDAFSTIEHLMVGGEAVDPRWTRFLLERGFSGRFLNSYGPTESTTYAAWHHVRQVLPTDATVPIGRPVANTTLYILDRHMRPVPIGVAGELYIGGEGLARGYLNRPELTAEKFVPSPFDPSGAARLYRSGDLCKFRGDGAVEYLGRIDNQVKVRGFRIELGEIEAVLARHAAVRQAVVVARADASGAKRLVAYAACGDAHPSPDELRRHLHEVVPDYMVPSAFVIVDALPVNENGKVDRARLPEPETTRPNLEAAYVAPNSDLGRGLAALWAELLGLERVGLDDSFFEIGGDSLLMVKMHRRLEKMLGRQIAIVDLFSHPTVSALETFLTTEAPKPADAGVRASKIRQGQTRLRQRLAQRPSSKGG